MYIISELIGVIAEQCTMHLYLQGIFPKKEKNWWSFLLAYVILSSVITVLSFIPQLSFLRIGVCFIGTIIIAQVLFHGKLSQATYASISFCALYALTDVLVCGILSLAKMDVQAIMSHSKARVVFVTLSHMLFLGLVEVVLGLTRRKRTAITLPFLLALSPGYIAGIFLSLSFCRRALSGTSDLPIAFPVAAVALLYLNILIILYAERAKRATDQKLQAELAEHHYAMQEEYYKQLRSEQEETRAMFHDINKYMQAMQTLVKEGDIQQANQALKESQKLFEGLRTVVDVGNSVVSVILNEYKIRTENLKIPFRFDVSIPHSLGVTAVDLYVLLGNTLDNAIEACCSLPVEQRYIRVQMRAFHNILFYEVENPYAPGYLQKRKSKAHGYGIPNIRRCVDKYQGHMTINKDHGVFLLSMRLNDGIGME